MRQKHRVVLVTGVLQPFVLLDRCRAGGLSDDYQLQVDAFLSHPFWCYTGAEQHGQLLHFLKNFSIIGGLLLLSWSRGRKCWALHRATETHDGEVTLGNSLSALR